MRAVHRVGASLAGLALAVTISAPASAVPPDGCYGLPDVPDAFLCISGFDPANAVPGIGTGPGTTVTVPRFCAGECFGPTPVTIPGVTITPATAPVMTLHYKGEDHPIVAGEIPDLPDLPDVSAGGYCAGTGTMTLSQGLYNVLGPPAFGEMFLTLNGTCSAYGEGIVSGWCDNLSGQMVLYDGFGPHFGSFTTGPGGVTFFSGPEITGTATLTPAPGESCLPGGPGADVLLLTTPGLLLS